MNLDVAYLDYQQDVFFDWPEGLKYKLITKGRRTGITRGAAHAYVEKLSIGQGPFLWGDTINSNIEKYFDRFFKPLIESNGLRYNFNRQNKTLLLGSSWMDFRSAEKPENWEGFGYEEIFLNEAGIILKDRELYSNSVLPMLLDYPNSKLIAAGVPKGKMLSDGQEHPFYTLCKRAEQDQKRYKRYKFTSYDNPLLLVQDIKEIEDEIEALSPQGVNQEIYGEFIEFDATNPFAHQFDRDFHVSTRAVFDPKKKLIISVDFNLQPFSVCFSHVWQDGVGTHDHTFDEADIDHGSIPAMAELIKSRYGKYLYNAEITGDFMGRRGDISQRDNASLYVQLIRLLGMSERQLMLPREGNPTHENSKADTNLVLWRSKSPDTGWEFILHPDCKGSIRDFISVQWDNLKGQIKKRDRNDITQRADFLDAHRYRINVYWRSQVLKFR